MSVAEMFARAFPPGSPLPAYLRHLLLVNDPAGAALFGRWYVLTRRLLDSMTEIGAARPAEDPAVRAAFLLVNDPRESAHGRQRHRVASPVADTGRRPPGSTADRRR